MNREHPKMEWNKLPQSPMIHPPALLDDAGDAFRSNVAAAGRVYLPPRFKIMTDEQVEVLRAQISAYATICEQLVEMHKAHTAYQDLAGARLGNSYGDPMFTSVGHKISARQRWTPTPLQLHALEHFFDQGIGTPSKQKIKEIAAELSQHGQISETNVYNWFQNRRARSKRKQLNTSSSNVESEVETDTESPKDKKTKPENFLPKHSSIDNAEDHCQHVQEKNSEIHSLGLQPGKVDPQTSQSLSHLSCYESMREHPSMDIKFNSFIK